MTEPHRCPVCEGSGERVDERLREKVPCHACKGRGVVWEPDGAQEGAHQEGGTLDLTYER